MDRISFLKFLLIAFALPAQYFISQNWSNDSIRRKEELKNLFESISDFKENYFTLDKWVKWYMSLVVDVPKAYRTNLKTNEKDSTLYDDDIALEVLDYRKKLVYFAESSVVRSPRPSTIKYRVGQVVKHKYFDLYGVIIGWDESAKAPSNWLDRNYFDLDRETIVNQPHYLILVDEKYQNQFSGKAYIAQDNIEVVVNNKITHSNLQAYFSTYDGGQYLSKKFLKTVYPHD